MKNQCYYTGEAAAILGVPIRTIKGWYERKLIVFASRDWEVRGYPHLISHVELLRLGVALEVQRLFRDDLAAKWNPGPFLKVLRSTVPDAKLQQPPQGGSLELGTSGGESEERFHTQIDEEAKRRPNDLLIALRRLPDQKGHRGQTPHTYSLKAFQESMNTLLVQEVAWLVVNVSNVARRVQKRIAELKKDGRLS